MKGKGLLGFNRLTEKGPLTVSQEEDGKHSIREIEQFILEIVEEEDIDPDNPTPDELSTVKTQLGAKMFNMDEFTPGVMGEFDKVTAFRMCLDSDWANKWQSGTTAVTTRLSSPLEKILMKANGCQGVIEAENPMATVLIFQEQRNVCLRCVLNKFRQ